MPDDAIRARLCGGTHVDPARFARNIERAYTAMVELSRAGKPATEIDVRSLT